jgi:DNA-binding NarL/FixJ family response regulator
VVDDFALWRSCVNSIVQKELGWHVVCQVSDFLEAVQKAEELRPDLIVLDIGLPKLNGIEVALQIRKVAPNSKILFVSAYDDSDIVEGALDTGAERLRRQGRRWKRTGKGRGSCLSGQAVCQ